MERYSFGRETEERYHNFYDTVARFSAVPLMFSAASEAVVLGYSGKERDWDVIALRLFRRGFGTTCENMYAVAYARAISRCKVNVAFSDNLFQLKKMRIEVKDRLEQVELACGRVVLSGRAWLSGLEGVVRELEIVVDDDRYGCDLACNTMFCIEEKIKVNWKLGLNMGDWINEVYRTLKYKCSFADLIETRKLVEVCFSNTDTSSRMWLLAGENSPTRFLPWLAKLLAEGNDIMQALERKR